jgi:flagellar biosynthesis component FlhA
MLAEGQSRAGVIPVELACLIISVVMLKGKVFSKATAHAGILGNALLIVVEIILTLTRTLLDWGMAIAVAAGLSMMTWYFLVGRRLLQLGKSLKE